MEICVMYVVLLALWLFIGFIAITVEKWTLIYELSYTQLILYIAP